MRPSSRYGIGRHIVRATGAACLLVAATTASVAAATEDTIRAPRQEPATATEPSLGAGNTLAREVEAGDHVDELPKELRDIQIDEKVGDTVPLDTLAFRDSTGAPVTLARYLDGKLPVILTFNYTNCPLLCSTQLSALVGSMKQGQLEVGRQFQIVTVSLDPTETPETAAATKEGYATLFPENKREQVRAGWHFLTGDESAVRALADAVGFRYRYLERTKEYVHPATLIFLSPRGIVTRYFHGIDYRPEQLDASIFKAGAGEHGVSLGFILACFHYDPDADSYAKTGEHVMRYGALGFVVLMLASFGTWHWRRVRRDRPRES